MENISIHHFSVYLPCTFPQKAQGWARICALYMEKTFTSVWLSGFRTSHLFDLSKEQMATGNVLVVCIFTYCPFLSGKGHAVYISAWAFCVARSRGVGNAKA